MKGQDLKTGDLCTTCGQLVELNMADLPALPPPYEDWVDSPIGQTSEDSRTKFDHSLDGISVAHVPVPRTEQEKEQLVSKFLSGLEKLFSVESNWTFLQPFLLSIENCVRCNTCADACPIFQESGGVEPYRPLFKAETLRRIARKHKGGFGGLLDRFSGNDVKLTWETVARLAELSYRCTLCRRCAQACPMGVDNGLIAREIRKLFSQELGIAPDELHKDGTVKQLTIGSSTGMNPAAFKDVIEFAEEDIEDRTGLKIKIPIDARGADILILHNAGEFLSWPENLQAFAILFEIAGLKWTLSSELVGYDSVNYGLFYDDVQYARIALRHAQVARDLGVKKVVMGECGHAHKAAMAVGDRMWIEDLNVPRESAFTLMEDLVCNGKVKVDPSRNDFPVTLHDPCNVTRSMGVIEPQRRVLRAIAPKFREMEPHGVNNYCCGGGSGFAVMQSGNFPDWRVKISGRRKFRQILEAFQDCIDPSIPKYVCAPCSNCKGQMRDILKYYQAWDKVGVHYGGLVELVVNAMVDVPEGFIDWDEVGLM
jgi:Fe-S oxidoreductase